MKTMHLSSTKSTSLIFARLNNLNTSLLLFQVQILETSVYSFYDIFKCTQFLQTYPNTGIKLVLICMQCM